MYHGTQENQKAKRKIAEALFTLMRKKAFSEITVTQIIQQAGVARATYYRNFQTKEEILTEFIIQVRGEMMVVEPVYDMTYDTVVHAFERSLTILLRYKSYVLSLYNNGFASMILDMVNLYIQEALGDMPQHSTDRYVLYYIAGAATNVLIQWLQEGAQESPHEIAAVCAEIMSRPLLKR